MHSNRYTFIYAIVLSVVTAVLLAFASEGFRPLQEANIALDKKTNILHSVRLDTKKRAEIEQIYKDRIHEMVVDAQGNELSGVDANAIVLKDEVAKPAAERKLPLYVYTAEDGKKRYVMPMQGVGLWGPIWGYLSIEPDFNTVYGSYFDHKGETPGLGAEIAEKPFQQQFEGKTIMEADKFVSVYVAKKTDKIPYGPEHRVDGISGGTITSKGVDVMIKNCVEPYLVYFNKLKSSTGE
ncbi:MAG: NADH:ubiquinone reductase (Na(+)-transporting) subunit C [Thermoanaerobaculia bacterium]|nr:NADH:ubiquinone reductase (Na(+)-transporting) subunit C [Thermoanaerobaculia bacterium]